MRKKRIAVAVSGGVDSLCALLLLKKSGHDVFAIHAKFLANNDRDGMDRLERCCATLGVKLEVVDLSTPFAKNVIHPFIRSYALGETPNPCAICNREMKFGLLLRTAMDMGADMLATGHYASSLVNPYDGKSSVLGKAVDTGKDQTYFLSLVAAECLEYICLPLGHMLKDDCRFVVANAGLRIPQPAESQDICFLASGKNGHGEFMLRNAASRGFCLAPSGPIYLHSKTGAMERLAVCHKGLWRYTRGQRKGLGIAHGTPLYVVDKDEQNNALIVGERQDCLMRGCTAAKGSIFVEPDFWPAEVMVKLRYRQPMAKASVQIAGDVLNIELHEPRFPSDRGQIAAVYDNGGILLASGIIEKIF